MSEEWAPKACEGGDTILPAGDRSEDRDRAWKLVEALAPGTADVKMTIIDGEPPSKSRPRFGNKRASSKKKDLDLDNPPENTDTAGERLEWPNLRVAPPVPAEWTDRTVTGSE